MLVTVTYFNPTRHSERILKWYTPSGGVEEPIFAVRLDGAPVAYTGAIYKRPAPTGSDYLTLKSGESAVYEVNLGDYYDLSGTGQYAVAYAVAAYDLYDEKGSSSKNRETLTSEPISLKVEGRAAKVRPTPPPPPAPGGTSFNACTTAQQYHSYQARTQAKTYASESENYLIAHPSGTHATRNGSAHSSTRFTTQPKPISPASPTPGTTPE